MDSKNSVQIFRPRVVEEKPASWATPYNIVFNVEGSKGYIHVDNLKKESAEKVSELLMVNHSKYHTLFHEAGLHNHIVHHLCTIWALGASPSQLQEAYDRNKVYQLPHYHHGASKVTKLKDPAFFKDNQGKSESYIDFLRFFQDEVTERGVDEVLQQYIFKGDEASYDLLGRLFTDLQHPIIHLGFGVEFKQPCLVAEALAAACTHDNSPLEIFSPVEDYIASHTDLETASMICVIDALRSDTEISNSIKPEDPADRFRAVLIPRLAAKMAAHLARWRVQPVQSDIEHRVVEMIHISTYMLGAAQKPGKEPAMDFALMHCANLGTFYSSFMQLGWLSLEQKARLLTWKGWMDMATYVACGCPALYPSRIADYVPKCPGSWTEAIARAVAHPDDGHVAKSIRAFLNAQNVSLSSPKYHGTPDFPLDGDDFLKMAHMMLDSVERTLSSEFQVPEKLATTYGGHLGLDDEVLKIVSRYVMWTGIEGAWDNVPELGMGVDR